jgi:hypothetical protein
MQNIYLGTRKGLFRLVPAGNTWKIQDVWFLGDHISMLHADDRTGTLYASIMHGHFGVKLHRSEDGGKTWQESGVPSYPERPDDAEDKDQWGKPIPWSLQQIWALEAGHTAGELWCGTIPGGLFRTTNGGADWQLVESLWNMPERAKWMGGGADLPGIHSVCVHPTDPQQVLVGVSCGGAWRTCDGGHTWHIRSQGMRAEFMPPELQYDPIAQDPHLVVQCRTQPEKLWCQHHNGIFRSINGGEAWTEIENVKPACFGFAVAVHPHDGDTAWFLPGIKDEKRIPVDGKLVVTRTRDGGQSFTSLTNGLPQEHAYDLVYRHALTIDQTGNSLAFGSTTGSCYTTVDQGDSWQCVSEHLPPIYCVKFGQG